MEEVRELLRYNELAFRNYWKQLFTEDIRCTPLELRSKRADYCQPRIRILNNFAALLSSYCLILNYIY